ncbi:unnamed protein product, partial [Choristocarpus tenellus]
VNHAYATAPFRAGNPATKPAEAYSSNITQVSPLMLKVSDVEDGHERGLVLQQASHRQKSQDRVEKPFFNSTIWTGQRVRRGGIALRGDCSSAPSADSRSVRDEKSGEAGISRGEIARSE